MIGRPAHGTKAATSRVAQAGAVTAAPTMPAITIDAMNTAAAAAMHATRAPENPRSSPRDVRRPNRTRCLEVAAAVSVMASALCDRWGGTGGWGRVAAALTWAFGCGASVGLARLVAVMLAGVAALLGRHCWPPRRPLS